MAFKVVDVANLLAQCHRRCCVCHRFCGVKMELHHAEHKADGGNDDLGNAIPLCFECHAEVNHYNNAHPRGRKFTIEELLIHKSQWLDICKNHPESLIAAPRDADVGPLEGMLLELEYNVAVIDMVVHGPSWQDKIGSVLHDDEYKRSIGQGSLILLNNELRQAINEAYSEIGRINSFILMYVNTRPEGNAFAEATNRLLAAYRASELFVKSAYAGLSTFLLREVGDK